MYKFSVLNEKQEEIATIDENEKVTINEKVSEKDLKFVIESLMKLNLKFQKQLRNA